MKYENTKRVEVILKQNKKLRQELDSCVDANELLKEENDRLLKIIEQLNDKYYRCKHELNNFKADLSQARQINQA